VHADIGGGYLENETRLSDVALNWMVADVSIIPDGLKHDGSVLRLSPNSKGSQHNEQARSFLRAVVRQLPCDHTTGESRSTMHKSVYQRFEARSVLLYDGIGGYRPDNMRIHVDFKHYFGLVHRRARNALLMISSKNGRTRAALGDFRHAPELRFSTYCRSSLHSPVPLLDATRPKVLLDACRRYRETTARRLFRQRSRQRENGQTASTHDHIVESRRGKCWQKTPF
jgi:hypothetical protein